MLLSVMQVRVLCFGVLKDWFGAPEAPVALPEGATVSDLLVHLSGARQIVGRPGSPLQEKRDWHEALRGIAVSVNAEYAARDCVLREGDEVGLLPPVSGGSASAASNTAEAAGTVLLTRQPIDAELLVAEAKRGEDGAVVVFDGIVRNNTRGRQTLYLDYEAYEEMAARQMRALAEEARAKFGVRHVAMVHRLGRLAVGETSVLIVVASAHRAAAFDACRWLIDTLKKQVPVWKKETFVDGTVWADGEPFPEGLAISAEAHDER
jgi:molybdopterin synthase catalytic subunit/molybdopterin converting factor small subunit